MAAWSGDGPRVFEVKCATLGREPGFMARNATMTSQPSRKPTIDSNASMVLSW